MLFTDSFTIKCCSITYEFIIMHMGLNYNKYENIKKNKKYVQK